MKYCHHFVFIFVVSSVIICVSYFSHLIIFLTLTKIGRNVTWTVIIIYFCIKIFKSFWKCNMAARPIMFSKIYIYKKKIKKNPLLRNHVLWNFYIVGMFLI